MLYSTVICVVVSGCLFAGCSGPDRHLKGKVTTADVVGAWKMTAASLQFLTRDGYRASPGETRTITFNADGSVEFASVFVDSNGATFDRCRGTWKLEHDKSIDNKSIRANAIDLVLQRSPDVSHGSTLSLREEGGKLRLWSFYGDPDLWEFIEYEPA